MRKLLTKSKFKEFCRGLLLSAIIFMAYAPSEVAAEGRDIEKSIEALIKGVKEVSEIEGSQIKVTKLTKSLYSLEKSLVKGKIDTATFFTEFDKLQRSIVTDNSLVNGLDILFVERNQYASDHHNTANLFQKGEINEEKFDGGSALKVLNIASGDVKTIFESESGVVRDPEISFDATKVIFSYRANRDDCYHIYEMSIDGTDLKQLTFAEGVSDIDPLYMPDGDIVFTSTREPKYCMCNRHIMGNLYSMESDGANITQIGGSTLFEGHAALLNDGRLIYDRWEYVDRNFGDAQGLWTVNPDGTKHAIYYGNNTNSPGGVIDPRAIEGSNLIASIFGSCHDLAWGAFALIDRSKGVDGEAAVEQIWPESSRERIGKGNWDAFKPVQGRYEDPFPLSDRYFLISRTIEYSGDKKMGLYLLDRNGNEINIYSGEQSAFDPIPLKARFKPVVIPSKRDFTDSTGLFYVQNVYEGTHMEGVAKGDVKYMRVIESPEKRTWTQGFWQGQGTLAPGMNWSSFENKRILGTVPVEEDGSAYVEVDAGKYVYFQLLDKDKKMIQTMRSGTMVMPNETNGCIGCHEDRLTVPTNSANTPLALKSGKPHKMEGWNGEIKKFSYIEEVQPIFDKNCMKCHDFDSNEGKPSGGLVLAGDRNPWFNASYINLYVGGKLTLIGAGPAAHQEPRSWGSSVSKLAKVVESNHHDIDLSREDIETIFTWLDLNGVYYRHYDSAYPDNPGGRSPLTTAELARVGELTGVNINSLGRMYRKLPSQIAFERPELSPCLDGIRDDKVKFDEAVALIALGKSRLEERPRADMDNFVPCQWHQDQLQKYDDLESRERASRAAKREGKKVYDK